MYGCTLSLTSALYGFQRNDAADLPPGKKPSTHCGLAPGMVWRGCGKSPPPPTGIRSPDRPARSESLYRLRYPGPQTVPNVYCSVHLVGKPEGKIPLGRPRRRWVDNIRMDLQELGCGHVDWIGLAQDRDRWRTLVSAVMNLRVPWNAGNFLTSCKPVSCSGRTLHRGVSK